MERETLSIMGQMAELLWPWRSHQARLRRETARVGVNQHHLVFPDFGALLEHLTAFNVDRARHMALCKLAGISCESKACQKLIAY